MRRWILLIALLAFPTVVDAQVSRYVCPEGTGCGGDGTTNQYATIQTALNAAGSGDTIYVKYNAAAGGVNIYSEIVTFDKVSLTDYITIRTSAIDALLPAPTERVNPATHAQYMPILQNPVSIRTEPIINVRLGPNRGKLRVIGIHVRYNPDSLGASVGWTDAVRVGTSPWSGQDHYEEVPNDIIFDRIMVSGDEYLGLKNCMSIHADNVVLKNSYLQDCKASGLEAHALTLGNFSKSSTIHNNYLEGSGPSVLYGGDDTFKTVATVSAASYNAVSNTGSVTFSAYNSGPIADWAPTDTIAASLSTLNVGQRIAYPSSQVVGRTGPWHHGYVDTINLGTNTITFHLVRSATILTNAAPIVGNIVEWGGSPGEYPGSTSTFTNNHVRKPEAWLNGVLGTASTPTAIPSGSGTLAAGTYYYRTQGFINNNPPSGFYWSGPSVEVSATVAAGGRVSLNWAAMPGVRNISGHSGFRVYRSAVNSPGTVAQYFTVYANSYVDTGSAGAATTSIMGQSFWVVKNLFEIKNGSNVVVRGNIFDTTWASSTGANPMHAWWIKATTGGDKSPYGGGHNVLMEYNWVRTFPGGFSFSSMEGGAGSGTAHPLTGVTIRHNLFEDGNGLPSGYSFPSSTEAMWISENQGDLGPLEPIAPHNTLIEHNSIVMSAGRWGLAFGQIGEALNFDVKNNLWERNTSGLAGDFAGATEGNGAWLPRTDDASEFTNNIVAAVPASTCVNYPATTLCPSQTDFENAFIDYRADGVGGNYRFTSGHAYWTAASDGTQIGANIDLVMQYTAGVLSGDPGEPPPVDPPDPPAPDDPVALQAYAGSFISGSTSATGVGFTPEVLLFFVGGLPSEMLAGSTVASLNARMGIGAVVNPGTNRRFGGYVSVDNVGASGETVTLIPTVAAWAPTHYDTDHTYIKVRDGYELVNYASTDACATCPPSYTVLDSYWESNVAQPKQIHLDLGASPAAVDRIEIYWHPEKYATSFTVDYSDDAVASASLVTNWTTLTGTGCNVASGGDGGVDTCTPSSPATHRWYRVNALTRFNTQRGFGIYEIKFFDVAAGSGAVVTDVASGISATSSIYVINRDGTVILNGDVTAFTADGFSMSWATNAENTPIYYLALAGTDLTDIMLGTGSAPNAPTASEASPSQQTITTGFQPDLVFMWTTSSTTTLPVTNGQYASSGSFGWATATSQGYSGWRNRDVQTAGMAYSRQRNDKLFASVTEVGVSREAELGAMLSTGFRLDWTTASTSEVNYFWLALKGVQVRAGTLVQTAAEQQSVSGLPFEPEVVLFQSFNRTGTTSSSPNQGNSIGAATTGTNRFSIFWGEQNAATPTHSSSYQTTTYPLVLSSARDVESVDAAASFTGSTTDGFGLSWTGSVTNYEIQWLAIGSVTGGAPAALTITTGSVTPATVSVPYTFTTQAAGGVPPYTWSTTAGSIPGLTYSSAGVLSGTPTVANIYPLTFRVTDDVGATSTSSFAVTVNPAAVTATTMQWTTPIGTGWAHLAIALKPATASGGESGYTVTRSLDTTSANSWFAGDAVFNSGNVGDGFIDLYSDAGLNPGSSMGPTIVGNVRTAQGSNDVNFAAWDPRWAIGNLNGLYGLSNRYGVAFGNSNAAWMTLNDTDGLLMRHGGNIRMQITPAGVATFYGSASAIGSLPSTTIEGWAHPTDATTIDGGRLYTGSVTAAKITVTDLSALNATIGGWSIGATTLTSSAGTVGLSSAQVGTEDVRFWAGHATPSSAPFRVTETGALYASNATLSGSLVAGNYSITSNGLNVGTAGNITIGSGLALGTTGAMTFTASSYTFSDGYLQFEYGLVGGGTATLGTSSSHFNDLYINNIYYNPPDTTSDYDVLVFDSVNGRIAQNTDGVTNLSWGPCAGSVWLAIRGGLIVNIGCQ